MADPISALAAVGAASSVLQIIDFSGKVLYNAAKLTASDDALRENIEIERLTRQHELLIQEVAESEAWNQGPPAQVAPLIQRAKEIGQKAGELLKLLDDLKVTEGRKSVKRALQSTRQAARAVSKRSKIERKQQELHNLTKQLEVALLLNVASKQSDEIAILHDIAQTQADTHKYLQEFEARALPAKEEIIDSLHFKELNSRRDTVVDAYDDTYRWAVKATDSKLRAWLSEGNGLFWVCGKPGSGKSTLMKFLLHSPETTSLLNSWVSTGQRWVLADFFFWYLGTSKQKSTFGLLQGILYKILSECPELVPVACPGRFSSAAHRRQAWTQQELLDAAYAIARTDCRSRFERGNGQEEFDVRLVFFIDGLDEFDGDHADLISVLQGLAAGGRIKVCVSCRPWNVFINAMGDTEFAIHLEHLTRNDIEHYVRDHLERAEKSQTNRTHRFRRREPQAEKLIQAVVSKANGVFFWVFLVVRSLISGFEEGDSIEIMQDRLEQLPGELIPYFKLILSRMDKVYQRITATALTIAGIPRRNDFPQFVYVSFLDLWPIVDKPNHYANSNFAYERSLVAYSFDELQQMASETARLVRSSCRDFLHVNQPEFREDGPLSSVDLMPNAQVEFIHRTVYDFLNLEDIRRILQRLYPAHLARPSIAAKVTLARAKFAPVGEPNDPCEHIDEMAGWICSGKPSDQVLEELDSLEVQYMDNYCTANCTIHAKAPSDNNLNRHRTMCTRGYYQAITRTFAQRLDAFQASQSSTNIRACESQGEIIRYAFGKGTYEFEEKEAIKLDLLDVKLVVLLIAKGADPDELLIAFGSCSDIGSSTMPLARFIRNWLFMSANHDQDEAVWSVVKLLIDQGAKVPERCPISIAEYRRTVAKKDIYKYQDLIEELPPMEWTSTTQALRYAVPEGRAHEIEEVLAHSHRQ
ncbi:hypothetical protein M409DRAFT_55088 [Zasmidium cellare ATCC 36951]|uniref:Uncharacterized protein n=1 Tax=Zasmidium cellare ATCC 36951 TaxID=1080233 RepID=A0A6A6CGB1_ZASCE|nr:uncharacterized protein M409DRAFT_55088 [Zasmidium cellare ATCC 36951]KAF2166224.1 hypothetical protein M409DRAFT_55088 [Zasmidium cellare ATCC 36951]